MRKVACGALVLFLGTCSVVFGADDWNMWNSYSFKLPIIEKKLSWATKFETRFREDMDEFYRYHFYTGPEYKALKHLTLALKYGNIQSGEPGDFNTEHRFMFHVTPKYKLSDLGVDKWGLGKLAVKVDNRLDWRIRHNKAHVYTWRYKLYPALYYPVYKSEKLTISPFTKQAFYFDFTNGISFNQARTYGGLSFKLFKRAKLDLYYMRLNKRSGRGGDFTGSHVLGTALAYDF